MPIHIGHVIAETEATKEKCPTIHSLAVRKTQHVQFPSRTPDGGSVLQYKLSGHCRVNGRVCVCFDCVCLYLRRQSASVLSRRRAIPTRELAGACLAVSHGKVFLPLSDESRGRGG